MTNSKPTFFRRPQEGDCAPYYFRYTDLVPTDVDITTFLHIQRDLFGDWIDTLTPEQCQYRYAVDKWTLGELIGHVMDTERVFAYRMMAISRDEATALPGFEQDDYVKNSIYNQISPAELAGEWRAIRSSTLYLTRSMNDEMAMRKGIASELPVRVSAYPFIIAGHVIHHHRVAVDRYVPSLVVS